MQSILPRDEADDLGNSLLNCEKLQQHGPKLMKGLRHGFILGSKDFVEKIHSRFLLETPGIDLLQQRNSAGELDV
jgi:hypothetical protein